MLNTGITYSPVQSGSATGNPRTIHDGAVAAAIGIALTMALETEQPARIAPSPPLETPWVNCSRVKMTTVRTGWQNENKWGVLTGWKSSPGRWRTKK